MSEQGALVIRTEPAGYTPKFFDGAGLNKLILDHLYVIDRRTALLDEIQISPEGKPTLQMTLDATTLETLSREVAAKVTAAAQTPRSFDTFFLDRAHIAPTYSAAPEGMSTSFVFVTAKEPASPEERDVRDGIDISTIPLPKLLKVAALFSAFFGSAGLVSWIAADSTYLVHPLLSCMFLLVSPFVYFMGRASDK